jgi:cytoskeleton protein RodZ
MTDIGATLREARMRERIDVSEIEAKTKIRARYLRALENEEWDLLPGPTFVRSFLRTYAQALGLDGKALVEEYRMRFEPPSDLDHQPVVASPRRARSRYGAGLAGGGPSRGYLLAVGAVGIVIVLLVIGLLMGGKGGTATKTGNEHGRSSARSSRTKTGAHRSRAERPARTTAAAGAPAGTPGAAAQVALSFRPSAPVYVCLIGDGGRKVIPGVIIQPPYTPVTYRATHFDITLGNNAVTMYVNGSPMTVPPSSGAIGYSITSGGRRPLAAGQLPTCR